MVRFGRSDALTVDRNFFTKERVDTKLPQFDQLGDREALETDKSI